jgi:hypothetical protein
VNVSEAQHLKHLEQQGTLILPLAGDHFCPDWYDITLNSRVLALVETFVLPAECVKKSSGNKKQNTYSIVFPQKFC